MDDGSLTELQGLMGRLADGDRSVFPRVFEILWPVLRDLTRRHLPPAESEDAAQEALVRIFRRAAEFDARRSALAWALGIARWEIRSMRKRRRRRREEAPGGGHELRPDAGPVQAGPEETLLKDDLERMLHAALGALSAADLETLRLYRNVAAATFRKRVERALGRLRAAWRTTHGNL